MSRKDARRVTLIWLDGESVRRVKALRRGRPRADVIRRAVDLALCLGLAPLLVTAEAGPFRVQFPRAVLARGLTPQDLAGLAAAGLAAQTGMGSARVPVRMARRLPENSPSNASSDTGNPPV